MYSETQETEEILDKEKDLYEFPKHIQINNSQYDTYTSYITYLNSQIALNESNLKVVSEENTDVIVNRLKNDRDLLLKHLNGMYDKNTAALEVKYKLNTNDTYIKSVQEKQIQDNNKKIISFDNEKMNKNRLLEIKQYELELKKDRIKNLLWSLITLLALIVIYMANYFNSQIFSNVVCIILSVFIFGAYIVYLMISIVKNYNRSKRFYSKFDFESPPYVSTEESENVGPPSCQAGYVNV